MERLGQDRVWVAHFVACPRISARAERLAVSLSISAKTEYACVAVLELASNYSSGQPIRIRSIAESHRIPARFLVQILLQLKSAGLVSSTRGAAGGYRLARDPKEITLGDVMEVIEGQAALSVNDHGEISSSWRALRETWSEVADAERRMLQAISFADLAERVGSSAGEMYYI